MVSKTKDPTHLRGANFLGRMEKGQSMNGPQGQDSFILQSANQRKCSASNNDIAIRRLKNRERQRRYRARKRLEADIKKSSILKQSTPPVELQLNGVVSNYTPRVHCKRNWKRDARSAHMLKSPEVTTNGHVISRAISTRETQTCLSSGTKADETLERQSQSDVAIHGVNSETNKTLPGRRDWKAEARKKKN
ncbi:uncharacterized protein LOC107430588 isoform X1 [Ziziphus jujuba]|uniref:Uncharacterized protein LOC107430588 isoform X1 n=2 Tax=Ziziphus jujuba TaxID=326968 RepID=A0A6P4ANK6_ZIZJJ|nr:uncharacterized protein LOC107430588 isoform X1 [Ziziphus jujuba]